MNRGLRQRHLMPDFFHMSAGPRTTEQPQHPSRLPDCVTTRVSLYLALQSETLLQNFVFLLYLWLREGCRKKNPVKSLCLVLGLNWLKFWIFHIFWFWFWFLALVYFWSSTSISFFSQFLKQRLFSVEFEIWTKTFVSLLLADKREGRLELALLLSIRTQHGNKKLSESERSLLFTPLFEYFNFIGFSITW